MLCCVHIYIRTDLELGRGSDFDHGLCCAYEQGVNNTPSYNLRLLVAHPINLGLRKVRWAGWLNWLWV